MGTLAQQVAELIPPHRTSSQEDLKDPNDPQWKDDKGMNWRAFMTKWYPEGDQTDAATVFGYGVAVGLVEGLKKCGNEMTRANLMKQMAAMDLEIGAYLPSTRVKTSPTDFAPWSNSVCRSSKARAGSCSAR